MKCLIPALVMAMSAETWAAASDTTGYRRQDTWQQSMVASLDAMMAHTEGSGCPPKKQPLVRIEPWYATQAMKAHGLKEAFSPEECIDLEARDASGQPVWQIRPEWRDSAFNSLGDLPSRSTYVFRTITAAEPFLLTAFVGADDCMELWLNGQKLLSQEYLGGATADEEQVELKCKAGENHLLIKVYNDGGGSCFVFRTEPPAPVHMSARIWPLLERDFPDPMSRREMTWERADGIWDTEWTRNDAAVLARRYLKNLRLPALAGKQYADATSIEDLKAIRTLYYRDHLFTESQERMKGFNAESLRRAIADISATFPEQYPHGCEYLSRLESFEKQWATITEVAQPELADLADRTADELLSLQREALAANPLVCGQPILYIVRAQYWGNHGPINTEFQNGEDLDDIGGLRCFRGGAAMKTLRIDATGQVTDTRTLISTQDGMIRDPDVSYSGDRIVFAMRMDRNDDYHIYEMNADGTGLRQLTWGSELADLEPRYLPDGQIIFNSTRDPKYCQCNRNIQGNLFVMEADGANVYPIGGNDIWEGHPSVMPDGRILYSRWEYVDRHFGPSFGLWTANPDGTNHTLYYGNNAWSPGAILNAHVLPGTQQVLCIFGSCHDLPWGTLAIVDRCRGMDGSDPVVRIWPPEAREGLRDQRNFEWTPDWSDRLRDILPKYEDPFPLTDIVEHRPTGSYFLVSRSVGRVVNGYGLKSMRGNRALMGIFLMDTFGNELELHRDEPGSYDAMPLRSRPRPPVVPPCVDFSQSEGLCYVQDVYRGTGMETVAPGTIKYLRIVDSPPKRCWGEPYRTNWQDTNNKRIIGDVPVEADGSAYFSLPANTFVFFQALDANKMMLQSMRSGTFVQPGELTGCIGCHESRLSAPPASPPGIAWRRPPSTPEPWYGPTRVFNYLTEVQPVFDRRCVSCHDYNQPAGDILNLAGDLGLVYNTSYVELHGRSPPRSRHDAKRPALEFLACYPELAPGSRDARGNTVHGDAWRSWFPDKAGADKLLIKTVLQGPPGVLPPRVWGSRCSRLVDVLRAEHYGVVLSREEFDRIATWIDLNAPYYGVYTSVYPGRIPLSTSSIARLCELLGEDQWTLAKTNSISFTRPEFSPALAAFTNKDDPRYIEALEIIRKGAEQLEREPREDTLGPAATPLTDGDVARYQRCLRQAAAGLEVRRAMQDGRKVYEYKPESLTGREVKPGGN